MDPPLHDSPPWALRYIEEGDAADFHACLDAVAREKQFLAMTEAPHLDVVRAFVRDNIANGTAQYVALVRGRLIGWCDIMPGWHQALRHCGSVGMGVLAPWRGQGVGHALLAACLAHARRGGLTRIELEARADNTRGLHLYERLGFVVEGRKRRGMCIDGRYFDTVAMGLLFDNAPEPH